MDMTRPGRGRASAALAAAFTLALLAPGCGPSASDGAPSTLDPVVEKKTQDMLKNKSRQYNERFKKSGGRPG